MSVPYTFATATTSIPLSQLDSNFSTAMTLGNTAMYLGNTTTSIGNLTLTNVTVSSVGSTFPNSFLSNSTATLGNATITLGGTTTSVGNLTLTNVTISNVASANLANATSLPLTTGVTGVLPIANGGTNSTATPTAGGIVYGNGTAHLVTSAGTAGQVLKSNGAGAPTWATVSGTGTVTSVDMTVPAFLSVSGNPITTAGTLALSLSGTALPISSGGTNTTSTPTAGAVPYGTGTAYAFTSAGTSGQVLTSNGSSAPSWGSAIVSATAVASTSGTSIDFTGIPSWVKRITVMYNNVTTSGSSSWLIQIGSGSIENTGYSSGANTFNGTPNGGSSTIGFLVANANTSGKSWAGHVVINNLSGNIWIEFGNIQSGAYLSPSGGTKTTSGVLDRVRITTTNGTDTFTGGSINIFYE